jgi:hypothetical protein
VLCHQVLDLVPTCQEVPPIKTQLGSQVLRRDALSDPAQDLHDGRAGIAALRPTGVREEVEDRATGTAAVVQDRGTMAIMGRLAIGQGMPVRTVQPVRMQHAQQEVMANLFIQHIIKWKL